MVTALSVLLQNKYDVISVPPDLSRRFECIQTAPGQKEDLLQSNPSGGEPKVEWIDESHAMESDSWLKTL